MVHADKSIGRLTVIVPYYDNAGMLAVQYANWKRWNLPVRFVIVDDGSPVPASDVPRPSWLDVEIYRIGVDIPWNQHGARNLGAHVSEGWLLLTDMDHVLPKESAEAILASDLEKRTVYTLDRQEVDGSVTLSRHGNPKPHPNTWVIHRDTFWRVGGYDEDFRGYGTDALFRHRIDGVADRGHLPFPIVRVGRETVPDASTRSYGRKGSEYQCDCDAVWRRKLAEGRQDKILTLDFPWARC